MRRLFVLAQMVRLPNTFTTTADILVGALALGAVLQAWKVLLCLLAASTLLYWSGMIWNDYFDLDEDRRERPSRPLACGLVSVRTAVLLGFGSMFAGLLCAAL